MTVLKSNRRNIQPREKYEMISYAGGNNT